MVLNGRIPLTHMTTLLDGQRLLNTRAPSVLTAVHVGALLGTVIHPPQGGDRGISGYRDLARQALFAKASHGDVVAARRCNMDPTMRTNMGAVGSQSHGNADRIDLLFNGRSPNTDDIALMKRYGAVQEFGDDDRNHFWIKTLVRNPVESDINRIVASWLNKQNLGQTSNTSEDGNWVAESNFSWMLQTYGRSQPGWYGPQFKIDRIRGPRTIWVRNKVMDRLWNF